MKDFFRDLTPEVILSSVEATGLGRATGRIYQLNSLENRVYEVELENGSSCVGKFYREGRWSKDTLMDEHEFLMDLIEKEIPAVAPLKLTSSTRVSETLGQTPDGLYFTIFPKVRGRAPDELTVDQARQLGRLVARMHVVGKSKLSSHRPQLTVDYYGRKSLEFLQQNDWIAIEVKTRYQQIANEIFEKISSRFDGVAIQRIHGDCHLGNLLFSGEAAFFLDFDDMMMGPPVQDLWLATPYTETRESFLEGYESMNAFDRSTLGLIEPLRALRIIHYSAWVARRWEDPFFQKIFTEFKSYRYWASEVESLDAILRALI